MSALDYNRMGELRIEKDRLQARLDERDRVDRLVVIWLDQLATQSAVGPWVRQNASVFADELRQALAFDGCPKGPVGTPGARRKGATP